VDLAEADLAGSHVSYHGVVPAEQMSEIMSAHDVLLFPTTHPGEGYSGTLVEAAMVGLPIVANRWQSLPEMFAEDEVFFVEEATPEALTAQLDRIVTSPELLEAASARLLARSPDFDAQSVFAGFLDVCAAVAQANGR
jgi:glycosyltransferase involved in cell wall biosynthesis